MPHDHIINMFFSTISLVGIWFLFILHRKYSIDRFREEMFRLRDEVFNYAESGEIDFNSQAYGLLRTAANGFIRFAHKLSVLQMILFYFSVKNFKLIDTKDSFDEKWAKSLEGFNDEKAKTLKEYKLRMSLLVIKHIVFSSPPLLLTIIFPLITCFAIKYALSNFVRVLKTPLNDINSAAFAYGGSC